MKKIKLFIIFLMSLFIFSSCETYSQVTYGDEIEVVSPTSTITYTTIVTYGTPYYINNILSYYVYDGIYYYPYYWNNVLYFKPYRYMQPRGFRYIPPRHHRPDYRFARPNHGHHHVTTPHRPNNHHVTPPNRPNNNRPDVQLNRPNVNRNQPTRPNNNRVQPNRKQPVRQVTPNRTQPQRNNGGQRSGGGRR